MLFIYNNVPEICIKNLQIVLVTAVILFQSILSCCFFIHTNNSSLFVFY